MRVGLLGGLEVLDDDEHDVVVAGAKLRSLLAVLTLHVGRVVPAEQIVDALWGENPPAAVRARRPRTRAHIRRGVERDGLIALTVAQGALPSIDAVLTVAPTSGNALGVYSHAPAITPPLGSSLLGPGTPILPFDPRDGTAIVVLRTTGPMHFGPAPFLAPRVCGGLLRCSATGNR
ncbi:MAG: AfsR/SARP family transcriptional regulator [Actinomycetia bacterium]|nr:AfsR/SARP family transcriptional regulator [Actinomycetes bacterium]